MEQKRTVKFTVLGEPVGKGRPKFDTRGPYVRAYTPKKTASYETLVRMEYEAQCHGCFFPKSEALGIKITVYKSSPASTGKRKLAQMLEHIIRPGKKPDWDNIGKIVCDALNGVAWYDDAQIVDGRVIKLYAEQPHVDVEIWQEALNG